VRTLNTEYLTAAAQTYAQSDPIAAAVVEATEVSVVVPSLLRAGLKRAGLTIVDDDEDHANRGFRRLPNNYRVALMRGEDLLAHGISKSVPDAMLHAVLGYIVELDVAQFGVRLEAALHQAEGDKEVEVKWATTPDHRKNITAHLARLGKNEKQNTA
jgi:hypothetical protein